MRHILARNVNEALSMALFNLVQNNDRRESRNGPVMAFPYPVLTEYVAPRERVLFSPLRNANPVFHLLESLWMLRGRKDTKFVGTFVKRMKEFSDDGDTLWGAYGWRWREFFGWDQIAHAIKELQNNPQSRRVVVTMWNGYRNEDGLEELMPDFLVGAFGGKDVPCNTHLYFDLRDGKLNMTICCRSNDILWGAYGANAVHMSILQEYVAAAVGAPVGRMYQFSNDLHLYENTLHEFDILPMALDAHKNNHYSSLHEAMEPSPLIGEGEDVQDFDDDLEQFFDRFDGRDDGNGPTAAALGQYQTQFFNFVVIPMLNAWIERKNPTRAQNFAKLIGSPDWRRAVIEWIERLNAKEPA